MKKLYRVTCTLIALCLIVGLIPLSVYAADDDTEMAYGADIGWLSQLEDNGVVYVDDNGVQKDALQLLKDKGVNAVRIRAFVNPDSTFIWQSERSDASCYLGYCDTQGVLWTAQRANNLGLDIMLCLHYSDFFADPGTQTIPGQWEDATAEQLEQYVYDYTYYLMNALAQLEIYPKWVQIGNEINRGILHDYGHTDNFEQLTAYLNSAYDAVKAVSSSTKVVTHLATISRNYVNLSDFTWFYDNYITTYEGKTDIIGISYYPYWVGTNDIEGASLVLNTLASRYDKEVMIVETGGPEDEPSETKEVLRQEIAALKAVPNNKGVGIFYWEPEANSAVLPDEYYLGATEVVSTNTLRFTEALDAFSSDPVYMDSSKTFEIYNCNSTLALNVSGGSYNDAAAIEQYAYGEWDSQKWTFELVENDYYKIVNKNSGKVLDITGLSTASGAACIQYTYNSGWNQMWKLVPTSDGKYMIQNRLSGLYLGLTGASTSDGATCVQLANDGSDNIKWFFLVTE